MKNPNFWYTLMIVALAVSLFVFAAGMAIGYSTKEAAHSVGILIGLWASVFGIIGLREQLKQVGK